MVIGDPYRRSGNGSGRVSARYRIEHYGVVVSAPGQPDFDYLTVFEVSNTSRLPADFTTLEIPTQRYAVFSHAGQASTMCETIDAVFHKWLSASSLTAAGNSDFQERYGEKFDPAVGADDIEMWVPVEG